MRARSVAASVTYIRARVSATARSALFDHDLRPPFDDSVMCLFNHRGPTSVLKLFDALDRCIGDEADVAVAAALTAPLLRGLHACSSPEELEELLALFSILPAQHAQELLGMPAGDRADFVSFMRDMTLGEKRELVMTSAALLPVGALLQLLRSPPPATCTLCAFKRVHTIDYMLQQNQDPFSVRARAQHDAAESELQPFTSDLFSFEHREPRDRPSVLHWLGLLESHARVFFAGAHSVDTATACAACNVRVFLFGFVHIDSKSPVIAPPAVVTNASTPRARAPKRVRHPRVVLSDSGFARLFGYPHHRESTPPLKFGTRRRAVERPCWKPGQSRVRWA